MSRPSRGSSKYASGGASSLTREMLAVANSSALMDGKRVLATVKFGSEFRYSGDLVVFKFERPDESPEYRVGFFPLSEIKTVTDDSPFPNYFQGVGFVDAGGKDLAIENVGCAINQIVCIVEIPSNENICISGRLEMSETDVSIPSRGVFPKKNIDDLAFRREHRSRALPTFEQIKRLLLEHVKTAYPDDYRNVIVHL